MVVAPRFWGLTRFGGHLPCRQERVKFDLTGPNEHELGLGAEGNTTLFSSLLERKRE